MLLTPLGGSLVISGKAISEGLELVTLGEFHLFLYFQVILLPPNSQDP